MTEMEIPLLDEDVPDYVSSASIEAILADQIEFDSSQYREAAASWAERSRAIPMMAVEFQRHLLEEGKIPTFEEYMSEYEEGNGDTIDSLGDADGMRLRVARAYPSLVRDVHFVASVRELGVPARRTFRMDLSGVDAVVGDENGVPIRLYFASPAAKRYKLAKAITHRQHSKIVDFGLIPETSFEIGGIYLYSRRDVHELLRDLELLGGEND